MSCTSRLALLAGAAAAAAAQLPPTIYWAASPVAPSRTALFAGSFGTNSSPSAYLCADGPACAAPALLPPLLAYERSLAFAYPAACAGAPTPCAFLLCASPSLAECSPVADPNAPNPWWALAHPPLAGATFFPGATGDGSTEVHAQGSGSGSSLLHVYGRALAFAQGPGGACLHASSPAPAPGTQLQLVPGGALLPALRATCYDVIFNLSASPDLPSASGALLGARLLTPYGAAPLPLRVAAPPPPAPTLVLDVEAQVGGSVGAALAAAAAATADGSAYATVLLGARAYALTQELVLPNRTALVGSGGSSASVLSFDLSASPSPARTPALDVGSHAALRNLGIAVTAARAYTAAVRVAGGVNFTARRPQAHAALREH